MIKADYAVFIGRFSPFHNGHLKIVKKALESADYLIIVAGSNNLSPNTRQPFPNNVRMDMINAGIPSHLKSRVIVTSSGDYMYNDTKWISGIQKAVWDAINQHTGANYTNKGFKDYNNSIALVGMNKDATSYYLNLFPQWRTSIDVEPETYENGDTISSTHIRKILFDDYETPEASVNIPHGTYGIMMNFIRNNLEYWDNMVYNYEHEKKYEAIWGTGPFVTVDAVVVQAGHVLLIERGGDYGRGLMAIPGGFLNYREKIEDGVIRELREETKIKVPEKVLRGCIERKEVYDHPYRSNRAHLITHAFLITLENVEAGLPKVVGSDDAAKAKWYPISYVKDNPTLFFEDHYAILSDLLGL